MHYDSYLAIARNVVNSFADDLLSTEAATRTVADALASCAAAQREQLAATLLNAAEQVRRDGGSIERQRAFLDAAYIVNPSPDVAARIRAQS